MPDSASAFLKLCSPCDVNLSLLAANSKLVLASSLSQYTSRTPRESDVPCGVSSPLRLGLFPIGLMCVAGRKEVMLVSQQVEFKYS
jgi:hypothetical protein